MMRLLNTEGFLVFMTVCETLLAFIALAIGVVCLSIIPSDDVETFRWILKLFTSKVCAALFISLAGVCFRVAKRDFALWVENY